MASLTESILARAQDEPRAPVLHFTDDRGTLHAWDAARLRDDAASFGGALAAAGIGPGDRVLLVLPSDLLTVGPFLGAIGLGAVPAIYPHVAAARRALSPAPIRRLVDAGGFRAVAASPDVAGALREAGCPVVTMTDASGGAPAGRTAPAAPLCFRIPAEDDVAYIQLSSGTTGPPKGVVLSHGAIVRYARSAQAAMAIDSDGVSVGWLPLFHDMGLICHLLLPILLGIRSVHIPAATWLRHPETLLRAVDRHRGTMTWMPNFAFRYCARRIRDEDVEGLDLSSLRVVGNGAEPIDAQAMEEFAARFAPAGLRRNALVTGYGFAENVCGVTISPLGREPGIDWITPRALEEEGTAASAPPHSPGSRAVVSCGVPRPGVEVRIADASDGPLPDRRVGRILVRSTTLFSGYLDDLEATRRHFAGEWFRSGDLGYVAEGELYVCGRESDLVIVGGHNVHPEFIEAAAAAARDGGGRLVAFGVRDAAAGTEAPVLVCETKSAAPAERERDERAMRHAVLAETGVSLADVRFVPKGWIVRTSSGKTARAACRRKHENETARTGSASAVDLERDLARFVEEKLGVRSLRPDDDLCALADSLQLASLFLELEVLAGRRIEWDALMARPTLARLGELLRQQPAGNGGEVTNGNGDATAPRRRNVRHRLSRTAARAVPYTVGVTVLRWSARRPLLRSALLQRQARVLLPFYALVDRPLQNREEFLRSALVAEPLRRLHRSSASWTSGASRWIDVRGEGHLEDALREEHGVLLLHSHFGALYVAARVTRTGARMRSMVRKREIFSISSRVGRYEAGLVNQLLAGRRTLEKAGIVDIAGDGLQGTSAMVEVPFHGRRRAFRAGFAHLAEATGAAVVPVFSTILPTGRIEVDIGGPLEAPGATATERIEGRLMSYVRILEERWRHDPGNVPIGVMRRHLELPAW